jgi:hypothetical protein
MEKWFEKQSRLIQIILLVIPFVNWVVEMGVRWDHFLKKKDLISLVMAIISTVGGGIVLGYLDLIWCLLFKHLFLCD